MSEFEKCGHLGGRDGLVKGTDAWHDGKCSVRSKFPPFYLFLSFQTLWTCNSKLPFKTYIKSVLQTAALQIVEDFFYHSKFETWT